MKDKGVTPANVETLKDAFLISIQNDTGDKDYKPTFTESLKNVHVVAFSDVEQDTPTKLIGTDETVVAKAMTPQQAQDMYAFIKKHRHRKTCLIHCTAGVARSGAVGAFVAELMGVNYFDFKRANPNVQPNVHVLKLLREARLNDTFVIHELHTDDFLGVIRNGEDVDVLREVHPDDRYYLTTRLHKDYKEGVRELPIFAFGPEFTGITYGEWLDLKDMRRYYN